MSIRSICASSTLVLWMTLVLASCVGPNEEPIGVWQDGKIVAIQNCSPPREENISRCHALLCEKELYERKLLPPSAEILKSSHSESYSDAPGKSVHIFKYRAGSEFRYPACELQGNEVVRTEEFSAKGQNW